MFIKWSFCSPCTKCFKFLIWFVIWRVSCSRKNVCRSLFGGALASIHCLTRVNLFLCETRIMISHANNVGFQSFHLTGDRGGTTTDSYQNNRSTSSLPCGGSCEAAERMYLGVFGLGSFCKKMVHQQLFCLLLR